MLHAFARIAFTSRVKAAQSQHGSRDRYAEFDTETVAQVALSQREVEFIGSRDGFYQATVSETGWPYVQHRGGPQGFLKVLDEKSIGFADFTGNRQYVSTGNLAGDNRVALIMVDYASRQRLKIFGRASLLSTSDHPELMEKLSLPGYQANVERLIIIHMEALSWNCSKHITPRFKEGEIME